jgi:hypothetical protein
MSNSTQQNTEAKAGRVQVGNLPQQEKELKDKEAENVKGGGGVTGGVIKKFAGEEIPQRNLYAGEEIPQTTRK